MERLLSEHKTRNGKPQVNGKSDLEDGVRAE
jgi:hypothetical protein